MKIDGAVAFITGGSMGVGKAVAEALLQGGAKVVIADIAVDEGKKAVAEFVTSYGEDRAYFVHCNVAEEQSLKDAFTEAVRHYSNIDLMLNNAGIIHETQWKKMCNINIDGVVVGTRLAVDHMRKDTGGKGGVIINTASMVGLICRYVFPVYVATKHAVIGFTNSWANNPGLETLGLRFGTVCPTAVDTAFQKFHDDQLLYPVEFKAMLDTIKLMPVSKVVEGFMKIIGDDESNGYSLVISKDGTKYVRNQLVDI